METASQEAKQPSKQSDRCNSAGPASGPLDSVRGCHCWAVLGTGGVSWRGHETGRETVGSYKFHPPGAVADLTPSAIKGNESESLVPFLGSYTLFVLHSSPKSEQSQPASCSLKHSPDDTRGQVLGRHSISRAVSEPTPFRLGIPTNFKDSN